MNILTLLIAVFVLLIALKRLSMITFAEDDTVLKAVKHKALSLFWVILIISSFIYIPYNVWILTGRSHYWDGVYITGGTALITIITSFVYYYKTSSRKMVRQ
ncbi:hypothetical protein GWK91_05260 [Virgibacillus sp. MSP4-1]|uniref:hypothetical protein n=1 Tax=Virgibacillus sp. MSP4-1 TaxID=2700081 RepID=UPI00039B2412|nr:hypothetical protein [Virgibacillus sp. MSP4-1]QHS22396.1 hypothetical protein GWK91_05260 [Virgibacillus sp. MSP4-1]